MKTHQVIVAIGLVALMAGCAKKEEASVEGPTAEVPLPSPPPPPPPADGTVEGGGPAAAPPPTDTATGDMGGNGGSRPPGA